MKVSKIITSFFLIHISLFSQHITNTLGITGSFKIKDNSATFFTLNQSNGFTELSRSLKLESTFNSNIGVIYKGSDRFIHNYKGPSNLGNNTFVGLNSGNFLMSGPNFADGSNNTGVGTNSLSALTTGNNNTSVGHNSLQLNTSGHSNTAIGTFSMSTNSTGSFNTSVGLSTLGSNTAGIGNCAMGHYALTTNSTGNGNVAIGTNTLLKNTSGSENVAIGRLSLSENVTGFNNTAVGHSSLSFNLGTHNTALGYQAGTNVTTGSNLTLIGFNSQPTTGTAINQVTLGNSSVTSLRCNVQTITSLSDRRDKKNIDELSLGLDFIMKLHPRRFNWDKREWYENNISDGSKIEEKPSAGFIAQELDAVQNEFNSDWLNLVLKDNPEKWEATYGNLLPVMVKAIQELKEENEKLKAEISNIRSVEERMSELELRLLKQDILKEINSAGK